MSILFKLTRTTNSSSLLLNCVNVCGKSILFNNNYLLSEANSHLTLTFNRQIYTFRLSNKLIRNKRATRPKRTNDNSLILNYEQAQFAENIGVTKSWNSWNTSNLLEGKRQAESAFDDHFIRKFLYGTFHGLFCSEIIIKRRFNIIDIGFLIKLPKSFYPQKVYFLQGYAETLLSAWLKCVVKIQVQTISNKNDIIFRNW